MDRKRITYRPSRPSRSPSRSPSRYANPNVSYQIMNLLINDKNKKLNELNLARLRTLSKSTKQQINKHHPKLKEKYGDEMNRIRLSLRYSWNQTNILNDKRKRPILRQMRKSNSQIVANAFEAMRNDPWFIKGSLYEKKFLERPDKNINDENMKSFSIVLASGSLGNLEHLFLNYNKIGDNGMVALADAIKPTPENPMGSLGNLQVLDLSHNQIGNNGMKKFSRQLTVGSLAALTHLNLAINQISVPGMVSFSNAIARGALANLIDLSIHHNQIGKDGIKALAKAIKPTPKNPMGALGNLKELDLDHTKIGDTGMQEFSTAIGSLAKLQRLLLIGNQIGDAGMIEFSRQIASGSLGNLEKLYLQENQIGDTGIQAFSTAIASGSLASLHELFVDDAVIHHPQLWAACRKRRIKLG